MQIIVLDVYQDGVRRLSTFGLADGPLTRSQCSVWGLRHERLSHPRLPATPQTGQAEQDSS